MLDIQVLEWESLWEDPVGGLHLQPFQETSRRDFRGDILEECIVVPVVISGKQGSDGRVKRQSNHNVRVQGRKNTPFGNVLSLQKRVYVNTIQNLRSYAQDERSSRSEDPLVVFLFLRL